MTRHERLPDLPTQDEIDADRQVWRWPALAVIGLGIGISLTTIGWLIAELAG